MKFPPPPFGGKPPPPASDAKHPSPPPFPAKKETNSAALSNEQNILRSGGIADNIKISSDSLKNKIDEARQAIAEKRLKNKEKLE